MVTSMAQWFSSPLLWLALFFAGIFLCASRLDKAAKSLGVRPPGKDGTPQTTVTLVKNTVVSLAVALVVYVLVFHTVLVVALLAVGALCFGIWLQAYKYRVRPLVSAGLPRARARAFTAMQLLWVGPASVAMGLFVWGLYRGP
jgi:hypothetical protein